MPRPRRTRAAPAHAAETASAEPENAPQRGRTRNSTHAIGKDTQEAPRRSTRRGRKQSVEAEAPRLDTAKQDALRKASDARDDAMQRLALEDVLTTSDAATSEANRVDPVEMGRKVQATPQQQHQQRRDTTGLELDDDMFAGLDSSLDLGDETAQDDAPPSGQRSTDTSSMTTGFFKRRGRAPSVSLQGNDSAAIRPSSRAGGTPAISSSFNIGAFRRRQREPSILGTGRKPLHAESPGEGAGTWDDEDDFVPEAESTPLNRRKTRGEEAEEATSSARSRKRKSIEVGEGSERPEKVSRLEDSVLQGEEEAEVEVDIEVETQAEAEVETQPEAQVEAQPEEADTQPEPAIEEDIDIGIDVPADVTSLHSDELPDDPANDSDSSDISSLPSPQLPPTRAPARPMTPVNLSELMAPPESSGSEDDEIWPDLRAAVKRKRHGPVTPLRDGNISDMSSPPSLTHSPNLPATRHTTQRKQQKGKPSPKLTTASLTGLLPRRRQRTRAAEDGSSDAELDGAGLANDEDELSYIDTRPSRRRGKTIPLARRTATNRPGSRGGRAGKSSPVVARTVKRTYSRRSSDKENPSDDEGSTGLSPAPDDTFDAGAEGNDSESEVEELKNAVKKFEEVDRWEMEFEEMTQSSSPSGAR